MSQPSSQGELFTAVTETDTVAVKARCQLRTADGHRAVFVTGMPIAHYAVDDAMAEAHVMVSLVEQGWALQNDVARAFGRASRTMRRCQRRFEEGGLEQPPDRSTPRCHREGSA